MTTKQYVHWTSTTERPYVVNLDPDFTPMESNNYIPLKFKAFSFLGGEQHFQLTTDFKPDNEVTITHRVNSVGDFFDILLANDALHRFGFKVINLVIPYFPAARQDRVCNPGEPLTIKVYADLINNCNFNKVTIYSPHSEVTPALLNNVEILDLDLPFARRIVEKVSDGHNINIVCPDAGAGKRVSHIIKHLANNDGWRTYHLIRCEKVRDVKDGSLKEFFVQADDLNGYPTIIFDDIVSMAGTFLGLADMLRSKNCGNLAIFTSHADCQEGLDRMQTKFDYVFTTNSKKDWIESNILKVFKINL